MKIQDSQKFTLTLCLVSEKCQNIKLPFWADSVVRNKGICILRNLRTTVLSVYSATLLSLQLCGWKASEEDSDLDKDLNRKMVQAFMTFFMFHCL